MLVCARSLIACYDGQQVRLVPGRSHVAEDHELALRFPRHFKAAPATRRNAARGDLIRASAPAPARRRFTPERDDLGRELWRLIPDTPTAAFRYTTSSVRVRLAARDQLLAIVRQTTAVDQLEVGGLLIGAAHPELFEVVDVAGPGPRAVRGRDSYRPDREHDLALIDQLGRDHVVGFWHTHPNGYRAPSTADLTAFATARHALGLRRFLALIVVPTRSGNWEVEAFTVSAGNDRDVVERSRLT